MKYYIKVEKDVKILVEDINFDLGNPIMFVHGWPLNHKYVWIYSRIFCK